MAATGVLVLDASELSAPSPAPRKRMLSRKFSSGVQALAYLPILQRQRDLAAGRDTAGFISGYRGSPLGGLDQTLWEDKARLEAHRITFQPGLNEDLAATAVWGSQQVNSVRRRDLRRRLRPVVRQGPRRRSQHGRAETRQCGGNLALGRRAGDGRRRPCRALLDLAASERTHVRLGDDPGAQSLQRAGISRFRPAWLGDVALFGLLGGAQGDRRHGRKRGQCLARSLPHPMRDTRRISSCRRAGSTSAGPTRRWIRKCACSISRSTPPWLTRGPIISTAS